MTRFAPVICLLTVAGAMAWTTGCGGDPTPPPPNQFPYVTDLISPMTIHIGDTVTADLSDHFTDPDGDALTYAASSSDPAVVDASVSGSTLRIVPKAKGEASVKVTAKDDEDASAEMNIAVTVGNRPPQLVDSIAKMEPYVGQRVAIVVSGYLVDLDGDPLTFTATSSDEAVVVVNLSADTMLVEAAGRGDAMITVTATDTDSLWTSMVIPTTVVPIPERVVLEFLFDAAGGTGWGNSDNWGTDADVATWYGVEVNEQGQVRSLSLGNNNLKGTIAPQLGELEAMEYLNLESNGLVGGLPVSLTRLPLSELHLTNNPGLAGELDAEFHRSLTGMDVLLAGGTDICAPNDDGFRRWLGRIAERWVKMCERVSPTAYLIQAAQSAADSVKRIPLVGGKKALLRVFATASHSTHEEIPTVKATFYVDDDVIHTVTIPGKAEPVPVYRAERSLQASANVMIPADVIRPDLEMVVEIDPDGTLDEELDVAARVPEDGRLEYRVYDLSTFDLTVIPFLWENDPDSAIIGYAKKMEEDEEEYSRLHATYDLLPIKDFEVTAYKAVESSSNNAFNLLDQTDAIRRADGGGGYFQGQMSGPVTGAAGVARVNHKSSFSVPSNLVISHELGHNLNLPHAPCGNPDYPDPKYPYDNAKIGIWGYDVRNNSVVNPARYYDMMSYCDPQWISDYFFDKAIRYRRSRSYQERRAPSAATQTILLWGGLDEEGKPYLKPAFVMKAWPGLPTSPGAYALTARDHDGAALFSLSFDMPEVGDAPGKSSSFVFTVPVRGVWAGSLASITLSGPGGSVTLDEDSDMAMTIAREGVSGPIRAFWDGWRGPSANQPERVLLRSRGIPGRAEWER